jgi:putative transposase
MTQSVKTIILKLHKPTSGKRAIIDEAMINYSRAYQYLLHKAEKEIDIIMEKHCDSRGRFRGSYITSWISSHLDKELNNFNIEPFKDSIKIDFSSALAGYLNSKLSGRDVSYPFVYIDKEDFEEEYTKLLDECSNDTSSSNPEYKISKLVSRCQNRRSLFFCRYASNRNYSILYDPEKQRYFAKIYLMNAKSEKRKEASNLENKKLYYIDKEEKLFKEGRSKRCFLLFPLSFGKYQEKYLKEAIKTPEILKTARLSKKNGEYYLSINLVMDKIDIVSTENYMGISRGLDAVNYSVVNETGSQLVSGHIKVKDNTIEQNEIHAIANDLLKIAHDNKCKITMEKLIDKGDNLTWTDKQGKTYIPLMNLAAYNQLCGIMDYKALELGLPKIIKVSSVNIFSTCPSCGNSSKANRFSKDRIICVSCGMSMDINMVGSLNLAGRLINYSKDKIKIIVEDTDKGVKFTSKELGLEYYPTNPYDCLDEFMEVIDSIIHEFYDNIDVNRKNEGFKRRLSLIKKIEANKNIFELVEP